MHTPVLVFDIETIPDIDTGKKLHPNLASLSDDDALSALIALRNAEAGNDFMQLPLHKIACLSFLWFDDGQLHLKSLTLQQHGEAEILRTFLRAFAKKPTLVSWNGAGFDLPVIGYRCLHHKISAPELFNGQIKPDYLYRYSDMHTDLMDKMSLYNGYQKQKLDTVASLCGFAGKQDIDGAQVLPMVQRGEWQQLATYCESDVLNTWLIYLRWQLLLGKLDLAAHDLLTQNTRDFVANLHNADGLLRHQGFLDAWA